MALSSRVRNVIVDKVNDGFRAIGRTLAETKLPRSMGNSASPIAYEYWLSGHLASYANKRKEAAERAMVMHKFIPDKEKNPKEEGWKGQVYSDAAVAVNLEVRMSSARVDHKMMAEFLVSKGIRTDLIDEAIEHATKMTRPAHVFTAFLISEEGSGK